MASSKIMIPIDSQLKDFKKYIDSNNRVILSARFGDGKSYFLSKFIETHKKQYLFIPIYPVNYQVAENKDIFEYIKRDILIRLLSSGEVDIDDTIISNSLYLDNFLKSLGLKSSLDVLELFPDINLNGIDVNVSAIAKAMKLLTGIKEKFKRHKFQFKNDAQIAEEAIEESIEQKGSIYEFDVVSQLICDLIDQYRNKHKRRKVVLLVEDLDRIDPAHIFRILNIFSAHLDRYNVSWNEMRTKNKLYGNKFKFDNIIMVCHYENIKSIYHHCYGNLTDFNGYIGKFSTVKPFFFSLKSGLKEYILKLIHPDLIKHSAVCNRLIDLIIKKYENTKGGVWGNIRHLEFNLKRPENIREEYIHINDKLEIFSINDLTRLLNILHRFDLKWSSLISNSIPNIRAELSHLINQCWLYSKFGNDNIKILKSNQDSISFGHIRSVYSTQIKAEIRDNVVYKINVSDVFKNSTMKETNNAILAQEKFIINFFNSYLNNPDNNIFE